MNHILKTGGSQLTDEKSFFNLDRSVGRRMVGPLTVLYTAWPSQEKVLLTKRVWIIKIVLEIKSLLIRSWPLNHNIALFFEKLKINETISFVLRKLPWGIARQPYVCKTCWTYTSEIIPIFRIPCQANFGKSGLRFEIRWWNKFVFWLFLGSLAWARSMIDHVLAYVFDDELWLNPLNSNRCSNYSSKFVAKPILNAWKLIRRAD